MVRDFHQNQLTLRIHLYQMIVVVPTVTYGLATSALTKRNRCSLRRTEHVITKIVNIRNNAKSVEEVLDGRRITKVVKAAQICGAHIRRRQLNSLLQHTFHLNYGNVKVGKPCHIWYTTLRKSVIFTHVLATQWKQWSDNKVSIRTASARLYGIHEASCGEG